MIEDIQYIPEKMKLVIKIDLCNWAQSFYENAEPEMKSGLLIFLGVTYYYTEPALLVIDSNEILDVSLSSSGNSIKIIFINTDDVGEIMLKADSVIWK